MPKRLAALLLTAVCTLAPLAPSVSRGQQAPAADQQEIAAQMQQLQQQVMQNMQAKGIDPLQFFQQIGRQMQDGTLDADALQKQLVDQGLIDKASIDRLQGAIRQSAAANLRQQLKCSEEEWGVLQPKIQAVLDAQARLGQTPQTGLRGAGMAQFFRTSSVGDSAVSKARRDLQAATRDPATDDQVVGQKLAAWRDAVDKAKADLDAAQQDLLGLLDPRQQSILTLAGIL